MVLTHILIYSENSLAHRLEFAHFLQTICDMVTQAGPFLHSMPNETESLPQGGFTDPLVSSFQRLCRKPQKPRVAKRLQGSSAPSPKKLPMDSMASQSSRASQSPRTSMRTNGRRTAQFCLWAAPGRNFACGEPRVEILPVGAPGSQFCLWGAPGCNFACGAPQVAILLVGSPTWQFC